MRTLLLCVLSAMAVLQAAGQQIELSFPPSPSLGSYPSTYSPNTSPNLPIEGPIQGTVQTTGQNATVTLSSGTSFLWFTAGSGCTGTLTQTISVATIVGQQTPFEMCLVNLPGWGDYYALMTASAFGFANVTAAPDVVVFETLVFATPTPVDISQGQFGPITFNNNNTFTSLGFGPVQVTPANSSWLSVVENVPCEGVTSGGSCNITVSPNPGAPGLQPGTYAAQVAYDVAGQRAAIAVTYTYSPNALHFVPVSPCRLADTRNISAPILSGGSSRSFQVSGLCGVPQTAQAYSLNVTAVPPGELGYLTVWPSGQPQPLVSTLNSDGRVKANAAIVQAGLNGDVSAYASNDSDFILDIDGYFVSDASALAFYTLTPCRIANTKNPNGPLGGPMLSGGVTRDFPIAGTCGVPANAQAYSLNFTAVPQQSIGYLTAWQAGTPQPLASTLNAPFQVVTANAGVIPASAQGSISVYSTDNTDLIIDVNGYFAPAGATGALSLYSLTPCRVVDTRNPAGSNPFSGQIAVNFLSSPCSVPPTALAYVTNATVVPAGPLGYLSLWPQGEAQPLVSTLNSDGSISSNMAIVPTINGSIAAYASNPTWLIMDVSSYFAP